MARRIAPCTRRSSSPRRPRWRTARRASRCTGAWGSRGRPRRTSSSSGPWFTRRSSAALTRTPKPCTLTYDSVTDASSEVVMLEAGSLWELIERRAEKTPNTTTSVDERGRALTFQALKDRAERAAAGLQKLGIREGSVVSWQLPTWNESVVLVAALSRLGAIQNPLLPIYREREPGFILRQAETPVVVVPSPVPGLRLAGMAPRGG